MFQIRHALTYKSEGNFRYSRVDKLNFTIRLRDIIRKRDISKIFIPHCNLGTQVARLGDGNEKIITPWFIRTNPGFDGALVSEPKVAIGILNADCPIITIFDRKKGQLILLHAGLKCLVPDRDSEHSIIDTAFSDFKLNPSSVEVFIGFGAGPCCYGIDHIPSRHSRFGQNLKVAVRGPRTGQDSLDLSLLAKEKLLSHGVTEESINIDNKCTACAGHEIDNPGFHSNIYEGEPAGRNLAFAWFEEI